MQVRLEIKSGNIFEFKYNLVFIGIIYLVFKDYIGVKTSTKSFVLDEDKFRHLFFGTEMLRVLENNKGNLYKEANQRSSNL